MARALDIHGMSERDIKIVNTSDADVVSAFITPGVTAAAVWNPQLNIIKKQSPGTVEVFNSKEIPGEIIDMMAVNTKTLKTNPELGKALVGAWFETLHLMTQDDALAKAAKASMAERSGMDLAEYENQLRQTMLFYTSKATLDFTASTSLKSTMEKVKDFSFEKGLLSSALRIQTP